MCTENLTQRLTVSVTNEGVWVNNYLSKDFPVVQKWSVWVKNTFSESLKRTSDKQS